MLYFHMRFTDTQISEESPGLDIKIPIPGGALDGILAIPEKSEVLIIFALGGDSSRHTPRNRYIASVIQGFGMGTLLLELLTPQEETEDMLTHQIRFDIPLLSDRLLSVTNWISDQKNFRSFSYGYFGTGVGTASALVAAAQLGTKIDAIVSRGGRPDLAGDALDQVVSPTLLIVGDHDHETLKLNNEALARIPCTKELKIIQGASHLFEEPGSSEKLAEVTARWFQLYLPS
jgi:putative phosphoribosyl transferase